ncbi:MAG: ABC transporter ATP-binding protein [Armatimonadota bacterium]|nr:ABC transporter ATP-binding protein [Armatimonadota bacterium]MDR7518944.1 ABC transporter ATP-binding protein [Armatimonadota bacterium]
MALLEVEGLHVYYGHIHALKGISISVEEGEIVAMLGSNGAGKTTTLRTISGLHRAREGSIRLGGERIDHRLPHEIVALGIGHAPEGRRIFGRLTVRENLEMGAYRRKDVKGIRDDLERVLALFPRLRERITQVAGTLSGGEQQMLAIARALMTRPRVLLLDEPSMGLAPVLVESIFQTVRDINLQGGTVLLVEQNAFMALSIAHRAYVLQTGEITLSGPAAHLRENPEVKRAYLGG